MDAEKLREVLEKHEKWLNREDGGEQADMRYWNKEQIKQLIDQREEFRDCNPTELYAVMNMLYADYCEVAKKFGINHVDFFAHLAKAWMDDGEVKAAQKALVTLANQFHRADECGRIEE